MKTIIHVNRQRIAQNLKNGTSEPVITVKRQRRNDYGHLVTIGGPSRVIYATGDRKPLKCGARVWIETSAAVRVQRTA